MESLSSKPLVMVVQPRQYWVSDNISSFLRGISFWYFLSNSLMWTFLIIVPDIFNQDIPDLSFIEKNKPVKSFPSYRADKPLSECVHVGSIRWYFNLLYTKIIIIDITELTRAVMYQIDPIALKVPGKLY